MNEFGYFNDDCMSRMPQFPDKYFDLAIVDPPYGIDFDGGRDGKSDWKAHEKKGWDKSIPDEDYFNELERISKNRIIWGANYFSKFLPRSMGWIFWDKRNYEFSTGDGELAFSSFNCKLRVFSRYTGKDKGFTNKDGGDIHPTQKPVALYLWLLMHYAKPNDIILDTHVGSASSLIAFEKMGFKYVGFENDPDYFKSSTARLLKMRELLNQECIFK